MATLELEEKELRAIDALIGVAWKGGVTDEATAALLAGLRRKVEDALKAGGDPTNEKDASDERKTERTPR